MAVIFLLAGMFLIALTRVHAPFGVKVEGKPVVTITLSMRERLLARRTDLYLIGAVILIGAVGGFLRGPLQLVAILACVVLLSLPARYHITTRGIAMNNVLFRPWTDFDGVKEERGGLLLVGTVGSRALRVHVLGENRERARALFIRTLRAVADGKSHPVTRSARV